MHIHTSKGSSTYYQRAWLILLALAALTLLAACGGTSGGGTTPTAATGNTPTTTGSTQAITIITNSSGFGFSPATITIKVGTAVTWTNMTSVGHTVTSDDNKSFDSGIANPIAASGGTYSHTFNSAGTFAYHCQIHPSMMATIIVQ